jgi:hypothetical protein
MKDRNLDSNSLYVFDCCSKLLNVSYRDPVLSPTIPFNSSAFNLDFAKPTMSIPNYSLRSLTKRVFPEPPEPNIKATLSKIMDLFQVKDFESAGSIGVSK